MLTSLFAPAFAATLLAVGVTTTHRRLPPAFAARVAVSALVLVAIAALPSMWVIGLGFLAHAPVVGNGFRWCSLAFGLHGHLPWVVSIPALLVAMIGTWRAADAWRTHRELLEAVVKVAPVRHVNDVHVGSGYDILY